MTDPATTTKQQKGLFSMSFWASPNFFWTLVALLYFPIFPFLIGYFFPLPTFSYLATFPTFFYPATFSFTDFFLPASTRGQASEVSRFPGMLVNSIL